MERAPTLRPAIGVWLNVSPDHLDRYDSYDDYVATKAKIFAQSKVIIANADDKQVKNYAKPYHHCVWFARSNEQADYYLCNGEVMSRGKRLFSMTDFAQIGTHNADNVMAVFATAALLGVDEKVTAKACQAFIPLPCRTAIVGERHGVTFVNDSKGTNIGATVAAINGIDRPMILLVGGQGKGQNFSELASACQQRVKQVLIFGQDSEIINKAMVKNNIPCRQVNDLPAAVNAAIKSAQPGDVVMLSPACASFDMFANYLVRGAAFEQLVKEYLDE